MNWRFQMFDSVKLTEEISLHDGGVAPVGTIGAIVESFQSGEAYMVELFGDWVKYDEQGNFVLASPEQEGAFVETIGVETVFLHQLKLLKPARETVGLKAHLQSIIEELSDGRLAELRDFADFLRTKQQEEIHIKKAKENASIPIANS
jgi:hypothetical protein